MQETLSRVFKPSLAVKKDRRCVLDTTPHTHLLKKVIQADKLGRIDNRCRAVNSMWPIVQTRRLRK